MHTSTINHSDIQSQIKNLFIDFHPQSRLWIYQSSREMNETEAQTILAELKSFCSTWTAHQVALRADVVIFLNRFIILIVDEAVSGASGCSIDKSLHIMQQIDMRHQLQLLNRLNLTLLLGDEIKTASLSKVKSNIHEWMDAWIFDNSITTLEDLRTRWLKKVKDSYLVQ